MIILHDPIFVTSITDPAVRKLVERRWNEILAGEPYNYDTHGYMIVVEPVDSVESLEKESGCPILHDPLNETRYGDPDFAPCFEALEEHAFCYELVFILNDDGFAIAIFVSKTAGIDGSLLKFCAEYAVPAPTITAP